MSDYWRVLIVEDEFFSAMCLQRELAAAGYEVVKICSRGEDAVEVAREQLPDVILMDIGLAGYLNGIEAAGRIREFSDTGIIFMSGYPDSDTMAHAMNLSPIGYLEKPLHSSAIISLLQERP